jgi:hypothetical protein
VKYNNQENSTRVHHGACSGLFIISVRLSSSIT